jgi:hypothetical protein
MQAFFYLGTPVLYRSLKTMRAFFMEESKEVERRSLTFDGSDPILVRPDSGFPPEADHRFFMRV